MYYCGKINVLMFNCNFVGIVWLINYNSIVTKINKLFVI